MIGSTVSHYKILEKIGEGGMGEVYLAEDTKLKRKVALKFLAKELTQDETRKQRFIQEARAAAAIEHPHIAAIHDIDEADGNLFIAMEHVRGGSLREAIEQRNLGLRKSLELAAQIADGLSAAHEQGVVHRDLKPENILVSEKGYAKIIDFGLAKLLEPFVQSGEASGSDETATRLKTKEGMVMGTVAYMSPEQAKGKTVDARSDVFSYGAVLYEMFSGQSPFRRETLAESLSAILKETPAPVAVESADLAPDLQRILRKALAKDPNDRYQTMRDLAIDVRDLREGMTSTSVPALAVPVAAKVPWKWAAILAVALATAVIGFLLLGRDRRPAGIGASGRPSVAVMYFESMSGDEEIRWLSKGLPNMLITDLAQTPGLDVVSSQRIHEILTEIGQEDLETINKSLVPEIAERAGAGAVVVGSIFKSGSEIRLDVQVQDVGSGRVLSAESVRGEDVFPLVDELASRIRTSLSLGDQPSVRPLAEVTTPSLEAFQLYSEGLEARRNLRRADAGRLLEEAVRVDPTFAMAYFELSNVAGQDDLYRQYMEKALELADRLPERQKLLVQATDANWLRGEPEEAIELLETLITRYPDEEDAYDWLDTIYEQLNQPEKSLATLERGIEAVPHSGPLRNGYGYRLLQSGRYAEGLRAFETYADLNPDEPNPQDSLAEAYLITGQPEKALQKYARVLEVDPDFGPSHAGRAWAFAMLGRYDEALIERAKLRGVGNPFFGETALLFKEAFTLSRVGRYQEAEKRLSRGMEVATSQGDDFAQAYLELLSTLFAFEKEDYANTLSSVASARESIPQITVPGDRRVPTLVAHLLAGVAETGRGNAGAAREELDSGRTFYDPNDEGENWLYQALRGELALAERDLTTAETAFSDGEPTFKMFFNNGTPAPSLFLNNLPFRDGLARVKKAQGDSAGAIRTYRELLTTDMSSKWIAMLEPRYVLELARLLDASGDPAAARAEYERFLDLWKNADPGLPELEEARQYLAN